ncbi:superkiller protein 3 [Senna tora]|uniref:Superkiller protein 3 n=1 Tax=Senna tora TaxID=362788 RepID=A0A834TCK9_9FABA|nr:superkiller protein 3 [Senna tora]
MWTAIRSSNLFSFQIKCLDSKPSGGFGSNKTNKNKTNEVTTSRDDKGLVSSQRYLENALALFPTNSSVDGKYKKSSLDFEFEERLKAVRRSALEQKQAEEEKLFGAIDYDSPTSSDKKTIGVGTKIGVGVAVLIFGLVFALGDFLPSNSVSPTEEKAVVNNKLSEEEKASLQNRLKEYEAILRNSPKDPTALEGAAVTSAELGEYARAASLLDDLTKVKPSDADVFRLLGEVKFELKDYQGSVAAYKNSAMVSKDINFEVLRGLTNSLLAAKKPDEAVQFLLSCRERLNSGRTSNIAAGSTTESEQLDPVQVELLLGKAYSDWGHVSDAITIYDQLISTHPEDFRGYLAKGIILKENNNIGDAERMFIQARFFAPENAKPLVDRYSR